MLASHTVIYIFNTRIVIPALGPTLGDHPDRKLCPVRALKAYLERTKLPEVRCDITPLFLNPKKPESDISPAHVSTWIKKLVQDALTSLCLWLMNIYFLVPVSCFIRHVIKVMYTYFCEYLK